MNKTLLTSLFALLCLFYANAQDITVKVTDAQSGENLSYAGILVNDTISLLSNAEGYFTIPETSTADKIPVIISFLGYNTLHTNLGRLKENNFTAKLEPGVFQLETVHISNASTNADTIMAMVKRNLKENYKWVNTSEKNIVFHRQSVTFKPSRLDVEMDKSTGFSKTDIKAANTKLKDFTSKLISYPPQQFTDMLCNYYTLKKTVKGKPSMITKFEVKKAVKLKDENRSVSIDDLQKNLTEMLYTHIDTTRYYRIKSGLFGTRDTVLSPSNFKKDKTARNKSKTAQARAEVLGFMYSGGLSGSFVDFIDKQELYQYTYTGAIQTDDNNFIYIIKFRPKHRKGKYAGTLYISETDYAVVRADYALGEGKTLGGVNLKFLLGVKQSENISRGTIIYKKRTDDPGYYLQYASQETGSYIYINRPLKVIEITEDKKDKVAFDLKVEANMIDKEEFFNISKTAITEAEFDKVDESDFSYITLSKYNPDIWKEDGGIEPLEEMKQFRTIK